MKNDFPLPFRTPLLTALSFLLLAAAVLPMSSCATAKLPSDVSATITRLGNDLPRLMGQATSAWSPQYSEQAQALLRDINTAAGTVSGTKKFKKVGDMLKDLGSKQVQPYLDNWKTKGKLDPNAVTSGIKGVNDALAAIRKQAKM